MKWLKSKDSLLAKIGPIIVKTTEGFIMIVNPYEFVGRHIFIEGVYEQDCTNLFSSLIHPGDCVLDIGANIGYFTLLASELVGIGGKVFAFEASPQIMQLLETNVRLNSAGNIVLHEKAVSDRCGVVDFHTSSIDNLGLSSMRHLEEAATKAEVPSVTIDSIMTELPTIRLVKIDVEGAEFLVLKGMSRLIERDKPYIILELTDAFLRQMGSDAAMVCDFLGACNYSLYRLYGEKLQRIDMPPTEQCNVLAVHQTMALPNGVEI